MEKYCNVVDQIPADYFNDIEGFETGTFLKLKTMRQKFKAKSKLLQNSMDRLEKEAKIMEELHQAGSIDFDVDVMEEEERRINAEQEELHKFNKESVKRNDFDMKRCEDVAKNDVDLVRKASLHPNELLRLREELVHDLCEESEEDEAINRKKTDLDKTFCPEFEHEGKENSNALQINSNENAVVDYENDGDCELDDLLNDLKNHEEELNGRNCLYGEYVYADYEREEKMKKQETNTNAQRIMFPVESPRVVTPELDEDGFPVGY